MVVLIHAEMRENSLYKNYSHGDPSMRLYIKNLGKQVVEQVCPLPATIVCVYHTDMYCSDCRIYGSSLEDM